MKNKKEPKATISISKEFPLSKAKELKPQIEKLTGSTVYVYEDEVYLFERAYDRVDGIMGDLDGCFEHNWDSPSTVKEVLKDVASMRKVIAKAHALLARASTEIARLEEAAKKEAS